ncbi:NUDIX hydrolase, partial [Balamuthia mandrillaris]
MEKKGAADKHEELIDVLTKEGTPTGEVKTRKDIHEQGLWHRIVHVWCVDAQSGELILQQRAADKMTNPNKWDVSAAGHVGHGESSLATAQIELKEELGLVVPPEQFRFLGSTPCSVTYHN